MSLALHDAAIGQLKRKVLWQAPQPVPVGACLSTYVRHVDHACWQMPGSGEQIASKRKAAPLDLEQPTLFSLMGNAVMPDE